MEVSKSSEGELKGTSRAVTEKTAAKIKVSHDGLTSAWGFANDKFTADLSGKYADKDYPMDWAIKTETKPAKSEWKAKLLWDVQTPDMSGAKLYQNVSPLIFFGKDIIINTKLTGDVILISFSDNRLKLNTTQRRNGR